MTVPPPPPVSDKRPIVFYDTECFPNFWLLRFRVKSTRQEYTFRINAGCKLSPTDITRILFIFECFCVVSFNGNYYDVPMINAALAGYSCEQLKWLNDKIILEKAKPWELNLPDWKPSDHIDVMEVAPGMGSQKQYAGRIHCPTMRDLPYEPSRRLTKEEIEEVTDYCGNDLSVLEMLFDALQPQIYQRELLSKRYGLDLRSKSDAQLAEAVLKLRCEQAIGRKLYKPEVNYNLSFRYRVPEYIAYEHPALQRALQLVRESVFRIGPKGTVEMPAQLEGLTITIGRSTYKMGIGGLHSREGCVVHKSDANYVLLDNDVASYYPTLILNSGEWPVALGQVFLQEYNAIKQERLLAKSTAKMIKKKLSNLKKELHDNERTI